MNYNQRSDDALKTELEYLREYVGRVFGKPLLKESFQTQVQDMIDQKIQDYIYQRYRDWTAPELARLKEQWDAQPESPVIEEKPRRGRPPKVDQGSQRQTG
jgi:hypothetical protein